MKLAALALVAASLAGCKKKKEETPISTPPPAVGAASVDQLTTGIGVARGLDANLAPTSTVWTRVLVLDERRAILAGEVGGRTYAIVTHDAGRTFKAYDTEAAGWAGWSAGPDGSIVLATGTREKPRRALPRGATAPIDSVKLYFPSADSATLGAAATVFPEPGAKPIARIAAPWAIPAVLGRDLAALIVEQAPRRSALVYAGPPGAAPGEPTPLPPTERFVAAPYGRPPMMLSIAGTSLLARLVTSPGKPLDSPHKIAGVRVTPTLSADLAAGPGCEARESSFQRVAQGPTRAAVVGVSLARTIAFPLPDGATAKGAFGCLATSKADKVVVEGTDRAKKTPTLFVCATDGQCTSARNAPFRTWPEPHEQSLAATLTETGVIATLSSHAGDRWGLYLTQSSDGGAVYEIQRPIGEGTGDRGRIELGALLSFGKRVLLLISADVTGTSRRGWYLMASDDDGLTWNAP
jgi:hypothetical protein